MGARRPCPICNGPVDASSGTCPRCAVLRQKWRCEGCAQVSTGFAYAYGACPHCGGALREQTLARTDRDAALDGVRAAFEIELGGRAFYQRAAAETADVALKRIFTQFANMEGEHMEVLSLRYRVEVPPPSPEFRLEVAAIFANVPYRPHDPDNLFRIAIGLERRAAQFFDARSRLAPEGSEERMLYAELAEEERGHTELLIHEHACWLDDHPGRFSTLAVPLESVDSNAADNAAVIMLSGQEAARTALVCADQTLRYGELRSAVARAAGYWRSRGIQPGDRVAIKLPDGLAWVTAFLSVMWSGAVAVPVNPRVPTPEWHYILDEAGFSLILAEDSADTPEPWQARTLTLADFLAGQQAALALPACPVDPHTPAFWCHSSGTSGKPKAVVHVHRFARRIEEVSRDGVGLTGADRLYASSKLFFSYPQTNSLWAGLKLGATVILDPAWPTAAGVAATVAAQRPTVLMSVPSLYRNLLHEGLAPGIAQAGVRLCLSAGEALPPSLREEWQRQTGLTIINGYGASEVLVLAMLERGDGRGFAPSPGVAIEPFAEVEPGMPTRLRIRVSTRAKGYLDRPQAQAEAFIDDAFCPADLFVLEPPAGGAPQAGAALDARAVGQGPSGWRFAGREDSLVKIHGRWVNLVDLEERLAAKTPNLREGAAVLVPDSDGVDAVAYFFCASDAAAVASQLQERAAALPPHQRPRWWHAIEVLPRGPTGKLLRRRLQELHQQLG